MSEHIVHALVWEAPTATAARRLRGWVPGVEVTAEATDRDGLVRALLAQFATRSYLSSTGEPLFTRISVGLTMPAAPGLKRRRWQVEVAVAELPLDQQGWRLVAVPGLEVSAPASDEEPTAEVAADLVRRWSHDAGPDRRSNDGGIQLAAHLPAGPVHALRLKVPLRLARRDAGDPPLAATCSRLALDSLPAWGREAAARTLSRDLLALRGGLLLVGDPGCGKSTLLNAAARLIDRPGAARRRACWRTTAGRLVAGARWLGEWQERVAEVVELVRAEDGVLVLESLSEALSVGGGDDDASGSVAAFLADWVRRGELALVAEVTSRELSAARRLLPALVDACTVRPVAALHGDAALAALGEAGSALGHRLDLEVPPESTALAWRLAGRIDAAAALGHATRLLADAGAACRPADAVATSGAPRPVLDRDRLLTAFTRHTGLPERLLRDEQSLPAATVAAEFAARIIGQPAAVAAATATILRIKAGLNDPSRPLASLLLVGPTGTGKTATALALADALCADLPPAERLVRLDLSEYAHGDALERLLGAHGRPGQLVQRVRQRPLAVVLLDEVEKAHPAVFDVLLRLLDEGLVGDALGRTTSFRQAVVVLTSNLGADARPLASFTGATADPFLAAVHGWFRPEFVNRLDAIVPFTALDRSACAAIIDRELELLAARDGLRQRGLRLTVTAALRARLLETGFDPRYGARPLQRAIEQLVGAAVARRLAEVPEARDATWTVDADGEGAVVAGWVTS